ncbi:MAG: hypothetical protein EBU93_02240 [Chlamydiae bacterium]|nr:hypothetical protein [Chlamydiota bacterium]
MFLNLFPLQILKPSSSAACAADASQKPCKISKILDLVLEQRYLKKPIAVDEPKPPIVASNSELNPVQSLKIKVDKSVLILLSKQKTLEIEPEFIPKKCSSKPPRIVYGSIESEKFEIEEVMDHSVVTKVEAICEIIKEVADHRLQLKAFGYLYSDELTSGISLSHHQLKVDEAKKASILRMPEFFLRALKELISSEGLESEPDRVYKAQELLSYPQIHELIKRFVGDSFSFSEMIPQLSTRGKTLVKLEYLKETISYSAYDDRCKIQLYSRLYTAIIGLPVLNQTEKCLLEQIKINLLSFLHQEFINDLIYVYSIEANLLYSSSFGEIFQSFLQHISLDIGRAVVLASTFTPRYFPKKEETLKETLDIVLNYVLEFKTSQPLRAKLFLTQAYLLGYSDPRQFYDFPAFMVNIFDDDRRVLCTYLSKDEESKFLHVSTLLYINPFIPCCQRAIIRMRYNLIRQIATS